MIKNLAELKRILKVGTMVTLKHCSYMDHRFVGLKRKITIVQSNAIMFEGGSWLKFEKASDYKFTERGWIQDNSLADQPKFTAYLEYEIGG